MQKGLALGICANSGTAGVARHLRQHGHIQRRLYGCRTGKLVIKIYKNRGHRDTVTDETDEVTAAEQGNAIRISNRGFTITTVQDGQNPEKTDAEAAEKEFDL